MDEVWQAYPPPTGTPDSDEDASFELSPASAEQITMQIRSMVERAWEYIAIAYQGRAYAALGYRSWDEYVDDRLGDLRLTVPREQRAHAVAALSNARMSLRAIAKVLGVGLGTIHRDLSAGRADTGGNPDNIIPISVEGRDGKHYPRRKQATEACSICGDPHPPGTEGCPWDLFAQGLGPRPTPAVVVDGPRVPESALDVKPRPRVRIAAVLDLPEGEHEGSGEDGPDAPVRSTITDAVNRVVAMVDELDLTGLIDEMERAGAQDEMVGAGSGGSECVRELINLLRMQAGVITELADRLERIAYHPVADDSR
jgi:hypothetical protein